jgi:membrane protein
MSATRARLSGFEARTVMKGVSPESPEERLKHPDAHPHQPGLWGHIGPGSRPFETLRRTLVGVYNEGTIHAGNLAYLSLLAIFPFFLVFAAFATALGRPEDFEAIKGLLQTMPPSVAAMVEATATQVMAARTGPLLWLGALVGLWTVTSFIETIREIMRRAYGTDYARPFLQYRLIGLVIIFGAVSLMMLAFSAQIVLVAADEVIARFFPAADAMAARIAGSQLIPTIATFVGCYLMFWSLAPSSYRGWAHHKWPGALFTTFWWSLWLAVLPKVLGQFNGYTLTYGGLAGVMVALLFFWLVGYGLVIGANINAALANPGRSGLKERRVLDELTEARWLDT